LTRELLAEFHAIKKELGLANHTEVVRVLINRNCKDEALGA